MTTALILAGAVAKGAFEAGVLSVIARKNFDVSSIVATSAGALNGSLFAAGIRYQRLPEAADIIRHLWEEQARWGKIVKPSLSGVFKGRGFSTTAALEELLGEGLSRIIGGAGGGAGSRSALKTPVDLQLIATRLAGESYGNGSPATTTFEHAIAFAGDDFDSVRGRERVIRAAVASAAFPFLFVPVEFETLGPCIDGGAVNNTPISYALDANVDRVIVVTGNPLQLPGQPELTGLDLVGQMVDIVINERLFRDLAQARKVNAKLAQIDAVGSELGLSEEQRRGVKAALGWRSLEIVEIRPEAPLDGNAFSALSNKQLRHDYIQIGIEAAERALPERDSPSKVSATRKIGPQLPHSEAAN